MFILGTETEPKRTGSGAGTVQEFLNCIGSLGSKLK